MTWLHGAEYNPGTGIMSEPTNIETPSLFQAQDQTDQALHSWLSQATMILKMIAGVVSFELDRLADETINNSENIPPEHGQRILPPPLYADGYFDDMGFDEESQLLYGDQNGERPVWDEVSDI